MLRFVSIIGVFVLLFTVAAIANTIISDTIYTTNTTWSSAGNNYIINGNVVVAAGVTLTIQSGIRVYFDGGYGITVLGTIDAQGTSNNRCIFSSNVSGMNYGEIIVNGVGRFNYCNFARMGETDAYWGALAFAGSDNGSYVKNCEFSENEGYIYGGAIAIEHTVLDNYAYVDICSSLFKGNYALATGGAINAMGNVVTNIFGNVFDRDSCTLAFPYGQGGAIAINDVTVSGSVYNNTFLDNIAYDGGAVWGAFGSFIFKNNLLHHNIAESDGGAIYFDFGNPVYAYNNTIAYNDANRGGGIFDRSSSTVIKSNILWYNTASSGPQIYSAGGSQFTYSNIEGGFAGTGNINADPLFLANYHLQCESPSIDAGDPSDPYDLDNTIVDQGAFYFHQYRGAGDANNNCSIAASDVAYLVAYFRGQGPAPYPFWKGDANGNCYVNASDVTYLVNWLNYGIYPPKKNSCADVRWSVPDSCGQCDYY